MNELRRARKEQEGRGNRSRSKNMRKLRQKQRKGVERSIHGVHGSEYTLK